MHSLMTCNHKSLGQYQPLPSSPIILTKFPHIFPVKRAITLNVQDHSSKEIEGRRIKSLKIDVTAKACHYIQSILHMMVSTI